jgi:nitrate reductase (NAD(P)H)
MATLTESLAFGTPLNVHSLKSAIFTQEIKSTITYEKASTLRHEDKLTVALPDIPLPPLSKPPREILSLDKDTPDRHVPRDPRLIRLTGVHPFNVEAPLTDLFNDGG